MSKWFVVLHGPAVVVEIEGGTREEAEQKAIRENNFICYGIAKEIGVEVDEKGWEIRHGKM